MKRYNDGINLLKQNEKEVSKDLETTECRLRESKTNLEEARKARKEITNEKVSASIVIKRLKNTIENIQSLIDQASNLLADKDVKSIQGCNNRSDIISNIMDILPKKETKSHLYSKASDTFKSITDTLEKHNKEAREINSDACTNTEVINALKSIYKIETKAISRYIINKKYDTFITESTDILENHSYNPEKMKIIIKVKQKKKQN